jgi:TldD protein
MLGRVSYEAGWRKVISLRSGATLASWLDFAVCQEHRIGQATLYTGQPLDALSKEAMSRNLEREASVEAALRVLTQRFGEAANLQYTHIAARRVVTIDETHGRELQVWALNGHLPVAGGNSIPLGWSGSGDGLEQLIDPDRIVRWEWLLATVGAAREACTAPCAVVLSPQAAAVLLHESIGHFAEGAPSPIDLSHRLGLRVAAEDISVVDHPLLEHGPAQYERDDEGVSFLAPTEIVREGILVSQLHSHESATRAGTLSTGNGRAALGSTPLPRMSNLICRAGEHSEEELIEQLGEGLLVHQLAHGFGHSLRVEAQIVLAERIQSGKRTGRYCSGGRVRDRVGLMTRVAACGRTLHINPNAMCGKGGQILFDVGTVAPAMRLTQLEITA